MGMPGGNFADSLRSSLMSPDKIKKIEEQYYLNSPIYIQFIMWIKRLITGKLVVYSQYTNGDPIYILPAITKQALFSIKFIFSVIAFGCLVSIPLGIKLAANNKSKIWRATEYIIQIGTCFPTFIICVILVYIFTHADIFTNYINTHNASQVNYFKDIFVSFIFPFIVLSLNYIPKLILQVKSSYSAIIKQEYINTARAYGFSNTTINYKYALKNMLITLVSFVGISFPMLFSESIVIQAAIGGQGIGRILYDSALNRQDDEMLACIVFICIVVIFCNYVIDILYVFIDPKIKASLISK